jgi:adenylosuccinate lyase
VGVHAVRLTPVAPGDLSAGLLEIATGSAPGAITWVEVPDPVPAALENIALWHERDISHSSVERMFVPDITTTLAFMLDRAAGMVDGLVVYPEAMKHNLDQSGGLFFSEAVMLAMIQKGRPRQKAYELVQQSAMKAFHGEGAFLDNLLADPAVIEVLSEAEVRRCFDLDHALAHASFIVQRSLAAKEG